MGYTLIGTLHLLIQDLQKDGVLTDKGREYLAFIHNERLQALDLPTIGGNNMNNWDDRPTIYVVVADSDEVKDKAFLHANYKATEGYPISIRMVGNSKPAFIYKIDKGIKDIAIYDALSLLEERIQEQGIPNYVTYVGDIDGEPHYISEGTFKTKGIDVDIIHIKSV